MPPPTAQQIIEAQRQDWNRVASGWEKWDHFFEQNLACLNHRLVADARLRTGHHVLDLGSGTGYPALLAAQVVGPQGSVIGIDVAESMLTIAGRKAKTLGRANVTFHAGDVTTLPFGTGSFDAVTSRFCVMFLPHIPKAASEIARVLKPGGWLAAAVWSAPDKNPSLLLPMNVIKQFLDLPQPDQNAPGIFRLAQPGDLAAMLHEAGLTDLMEQEFLAEWSYPSAGDYYRSLMDIAAPIQNLLAQLTPQQQREAEQKIVAAAEEYRRDRALVFPFAVRIVAAHKPL